MTTADDRKNDASTDSATKPALALRREKVKTFGAVRSGIQTGRAKPDTMCNHSVW